MLCGTSQLWNLRCHLGINPNVQAQDTRNSVLTDALRGYFSNSEPGFCEEGISGPEKTAWARRELLAVIDGEVARLQGVRQALDLEMFRQDREEVVDRALFDPSPGRRKRARPCRLPAI